MKFKFKISIEIDEPLNKDENEEWVKMNVQEQLDAIKEMEKDIEAGLIHLLGIDESYKSIKKLEVHVE